MPYRQKIDGCLDSIIGNRGISRSNLNSLLGEAQKSVNKIRNQIDKGELPVFLPGRNKDNIKEIKDIAGHINDNFGSLVVLGIGGSSLGGQAFYGLKAAELMSKQSNIAVSFLDNVDPHSFEHLSSSLNIADIFFLVISKSGNTMETLAQFGLFLTMAEKSLGREKLKNHFLIITDPTDNPLRRLGKKLDITILDHEAGIGGRYSAFTNVGLLPASFAGLDPDKIISGAEHVTENFLKNKVDDSNNPVFGAAINCYYIRNKAHATVMMPYIDRLSAFATWYRQIWAESIGKNGIGTTPIRALGTLDQHSQLQLYLDGPQDKIFTLITLKNDEDGFKIDRNIFADESLSYLHDKTMGNVINAAAAGTLKTFINHKCPVRVFELGRLDEESLGGLMMYFMLETVITGYMLGINPFDQPAVEEGKAIAKKILSERQ